MPIAPTPTFRREWGREFRHSVIEASPASGGGKLAKRAGGGW